MKWVRANDGALFGVCKGLARTLDIPVGLFRLLWLFSVLFVGVGVGLYLMCAICLPREDKQEKARQGRILGVCARIARKTGLEVGIVRFLALTLMLLSLGSTLVGYVVLHFVLDHNSANNPSTPPATT